MTDSVGSARRRLVRLLGLTEADARRAVEEVLDCFSVPVDEYIQARHGQLQEQGQPGRDIYQRIAVELPALRFPGPTLTPRQIRRRVYG